MSTAEMSERMQDQFITIIVHELRYPLVPIRNAAAMLRQDPVDTATIRRAADIIDRQARGMHRLIGDLADVSRMQSGAFELRRTRAPLSGLVECALESAAPFANERGQFLSASVTPEPVYLHMDVPRLAHALHQIITNATRYSDRNGDILVRARREGAEAVITVADTGIGIPQRDLESIFRLFARSAQGARTEAGLGVGLYLARYLIEAHQGTVVAASPGPGRGSVFTIRLPCEAPSPESATPRPVAPAAEASADDPIRA